MTSTGISTKIAVETYNVGGYLDGRPIAQLGIIKSSDGQYIATDKNQKTTSSGHFQTAGIYAYQEVPKSLVDTLHSIVTNGGYTFAQQYSWSNGGERTAPFVKTYGSTYNGIVWSPEVQKVADEITPSYLRDDEALPPAKRLGCRTSNWVVLMNKATGTRYTIISVHGNSGANDAKRTRLISALIGEAVAKKFTNPVILGDFNMKPDTLYALVEHEKCNHRDHFPFQNLESYIPEANKRKITNSNPADSFFERLDWGLFAKNIVVHGEHIPSFANIPPPKPDQKVKQSDHVWVRYIVGGGARPQNPPATC
jgi:endonuclease/exonuclease/phosphatase family metal-dependent hydrolase